MYQAAYSWPSRICFGILGLACSNQFRNRIIARFEQSPPAAQKRDGQSRARRAWLGDDAAIGSNAPLQPRAGGERQRFDDLSRQRHLVLARYGRNHGKIVYQGP